jgi:predicted RNA-binding Zn ribbon-like protein
VPDSRPAPVGFPTDWLDPRRGLSAGDLDLAVLLVNSLDALEDPADRLTNIDWVRSAMHQVGRAEVGDRLRAGDVERLRALRAGLRAVFVAPNDSSVLAAANALLDCYPPTVRLAAAPAGSSDRPRLTSGAGLAGTSWLEACLPWTLAQWVAERGPRRLGRCGSDPCGCVFVDRTRAGSRRYCCNYCNDRAAARAYRSRRRLD